MIIHKATDRGIQDHGWLKAAHSFSFAHFHDPTRMSFGLLRVLNDDTVAAGKGFGTHGHDNMEIVTIPLSGKLAHKDSLRSSGSISEGEVQIMTAGSGIEHSEFNGSTTNEVNLLQIWIFPKIRDIEPRYDQRKFDLESKRNAFVTVISSEEESGVMWINQESVFSLGLFDTGANANYKIKHPGNGAYVFLIEGKAEINGISLGKRDAVGVSDTSNFTVSVSESAKILIIEVPMK